MLPLRSWLRVALIAGVAYVLIGRLFPQPAGHLREWRLAAWLASAIVFAAHIFYEQFRLRSSRLQTALHVAMAVALAAAALAFAAMIHSLSATSTIRPALAIAIVAWPVITALPAFVVAFVAAAVVARLRAPPSSSLL